MPQEDTDPIPPDEAITDPSDLRARKGKGPSERTTEPDSEVLEEILQGVRRDRPPPAHPKKQIDGSTHGEQAAAYHAPPRVPKPAVDTPPPEPAVEVQRTDPGERIAKTVELTRVAEEKTRPSYVLWLVAALVGAGVIVIVWWWMRPPPASDVPVASTVATAAATSTPTSTSTPTPTPTSTSTPTTTTTGRPTATATATATPAATPTAKPSASIRKGDISPGF
jgi:hypothetical protein